MLLIKINYVCIRDVECDDIYEITCHLDIKIKIKRKIQ